MNSLFRRSLNSGIFFSNLFAILVIAFTRLLVFLKVREGFLETMMYTEFVVLPVLMGIISAWFWAELNFKTKNYLGYSLINGTIAILLSFVFLGEGIICLLIVSPLIFTFIISGALLGRSLFRKKNDKLNMSIGGLFIVLFLVDLFSAHSYDRSVSDTMIIRASPDEVWKHVVAYDKIKSPEKFWLFRLGLPSPSETTVDGYCKGAGRKCIFSNGYVFDEKMTEYEPEKILTFDIIDQPRDPEIMGHIDILRGQFILRDNGDGTTTLTGTSWYRLYVSPSWYFDLWARSITRNVHFRVMEHIRDLSESGSHV